MKSAAKSDKAIAAVASDWVMRRADGLCPEEQRELVDWLAADSRHLEVYSRLSKTAGVFDRASQQGSTNEIVNRLEARGRRRRARRQSGMMAAALAVVVLAFVYLPWRGAPANSPALALSKELVRKLPDGSIVELNDGAEIAVLYEAAIRRVQLLRGEAHFRVEKDAARRFVVQAGGVDVVAVGTEFTVQMASQAVEVVVTEGRVAVDRSAPSVGVTAASSNRTPTLVDAGQRVLVGREQQTTTPAQVQTLTPTELTDRLAWRIPRLEFAGMEMSEAVALMNRSNRLQIVLGDPAVGRLRVSGVFRADNPAGFVRIVADTFELKTEQRSENEIVLRRP